MLLDELVTVIKTNKERIANHGASLRENEIRTRLALIDPLLQALDWDTSNPAVVTPEYSGSGNRADYALRNESGKPEVIIEAKKLDESLDSHRMQMLSYANMLGIPHAGLTDGNRWQLYKVFGQAPIDQRRILNVSIATMPTHETALKLLLLWRSNLGLGQPPVEASDPIVVSPPLGGSWIRLNQIGDFKGKPSPTAVKFRDSLSRPIHAWWQVLAEIAEYLVDIGILTANKLPIKQLSFINSSPVGLSGKAFANSHLVSGGIYLNAIRSSASSVENSKRLLQHFGVPLDNVELMFK